MGKEVWIILMAENILANLQTIKKMASELWLGLIKESTQDYGKMENNTAKESIQIMKECKSKECGNTEDQLDMCPEDLITDFDIKRLFFVVQYYIIYQWEQISYYV